MVFHPPVAIVAKAGDAGILQRILQNNPEKLAVILGLENNRLTICLLGSNTSSPGTSPTPDPPPPPPPGEETWPEEEMINFDDDEEYEEFFTP